MSIPLLFAKRRFNPRRLFANGEQGVWYDPSDFSTMFQDSAGTTPVTDVEQPVGLILDKSGNGHHASQSTTTSRPILRNLYNLLTDTENFPSWVVMATATTVSNSTTAPNSTLTADTIIYPGGTATQYPGIAKSLSISSSATYTYSVYVKDINARYIMLSVRGDSSNEYVACEFDLQTNAVSRTRQTGSGWAYVTASGSVTSDEQGFKLIKFNFTTGTVTTGIAFFNVSNGVANVNSGGYLNGYSGARSLYAWGASLVPANEAHLPYQRVVTNTLGSGVYDTDVTKFPPYLAFDGTDDSLVTGNINFSATDKMSVFAGVRKLRDTPVGTLIVLGADYLANGAFEIGAPWSYASVQRNYIVAVRGSTSEGSNVNIEAYGGSNATITNVLTANILSAAANSAASQSVRINAVTLAGTSLENLNSTGVFANAAITIGNRPAGGSLFNGRIYSLIVRGELTSSPQLEQTERWVNGKTGAY